MKNNRRILGAVILVGGITLVAFSIFLKNYVKTASTEITEKQEQLEQGGGFVPRRPFPRARAEQAHEQAAEKIGEGKERFSIYIELSTWSKISGIIFIILGAGLLLIKPKKS